MYFVLSLRYAKLGVSHTTRTMCDGETDGEVYHFVSREKFQHKTRNGKFLAVSEFLGNSYGLCNSHQHFL